MSEKAPMEPGHVKQEVLQEAGVDIEGDVALTNQGDRALKRYRGEKATDELERKAREIHEKAEQASANKAAERTYDARFQKDRKSTVAELRAAEAKLAALTAQAEPLRQQATARVALGDEARYKEQTRVEKIKEKLQPIREEIEDIERRILSLKRDLNIDK